MNRARPKHTTGWEDEQMAALVCDGKYAGDQIIQAGEDATCSVCGAKVRLVWNVYVEDVLP